MTPDLDKAREAAKVGADDCIACGAFVGRLFDRGGHVCGNATTAETSEARYAYIALLEAALSAKEQECEDLSVDKAAAKFAAREMTDRRSELKAALAAERERAGKWEWVAREMADRGSSCGFTLEDCFVEYAADHPVSDERTP